MSIAQTKKQRTKVFISYSHKDIQWLERIQVHLKPLEREGVLEHWDDTRITPGEKWRDEIREALASAKIAVLLISADFLASDFIVNNELPPLLAASEKDGAGILPVILSPSRFENTPTLNQFQSVNPPSKPLIGMAKAEQEEVFVRLANIVDRVVRLPEENKEESFTPKQLLTGSSDKVEQKVLTEASYESIHLNIKDGTPLADLVYAVHPYIKNCILGVKSVANCKALHDHLHDLRQYVIRPLQEEVLPSWKRDGILSDDLRKQIKGYQMKALCSLDKIEDAIESIGPAHTGLRTSIDGLLLLPEFWDSKKDSAGSHPEWKVFDDKISNRFGGEVQEAFSEAGRSIDKEREYLHEAYKDMQAELKKAQKLIQLDEEEQDQLKKKLSRVEANRLRMKKSLILHKKWQESHDKLAEVEGFRESDSFDSKLESYFGSPLMKLYKLVQDEIDAAGTDSTGDLVNDFRHLKASIRALRRGGGKEAFDNMRKRFDNAFFSVDKRTKDEVDEAKKRAENLDKWLDELLSRRR